MKKLVPKDKKTDYYQSGFKWKCSIVCMIPPMSENISIYIIHQLYSWLLWWWSVGSTLDSFIFVFILCLILKFYKRRMHLHSLPSPDLSWLWPWSWLCRCLLAGLKPWLGLGKTVVLWVTCGILVAWGCLLVGVWKNIRSLMDPFLLDD